MSKSGSDQIHFRCPCGQKIAVPVEWAGKRAKCPKCRAPQVVPKDREETSSKPIVATDGAEDFFPELTQGEPVLRLAPEAPSSQKPAPLAPEDGKSCSACGKTWPKSAKICVNCGIDLKTGRAIQMRDDQHLDRVYETTETLVTTLSWIFPFGLYPVASEAFGLRTPWLIRGVALLTIAISFWFFYVDIYNDAPKLEHELLMQWSGSVAGREAEIESALAQAREEGASEQEIAEARQQIAGQSVGMFRWYQPLTAAFLHGDILHLAGNLLFLFVLGSRVNMLIGNFLTLVAYPLLAFASGLISHVAESNQPLRPSLGASGVIMGLAGMYFLLLPVTKVHVAIWLRWGLIRGFHLSLNIFPVAGFWVVAFYIGIDVLMIYLRADDGVGHWAHFGGFLAGVALAAILLLVRLINARGGDLFSVLFGRYAWAILGKPTAKRLSLP